MDIRKVKAVEMMEGDGAQVKRLFPSHEVHHFDPFVLIDHFSIAPPAGFPTHPHKGFEAITYLIEGAFHHKDNLGNDSWVKPKGLQRFTAGSGLEHSEMPADEGMSSGLQLWINLPRDKKEIKPSYQQVDESEIPEKKFEGGVTRTVAGHHSPLELNNDIEIRDFIFDKPSATTHESNPDHKGFMYVLSGHVRVDGNGVKAGEALFFLRGDKLPIEALEPSRVYSVFGKPLHEPIRQRGPYVL